VPATEPAVSQSPPAASQERQVE